MDRSLLQHYERELRFMRELGPLRETMSEARALARALRDAREGKLAG